MIDHFDSTHFLKESNYSLFELFKGYEESRSAVATYVSIPGATVEAKVSV